MPKERIVSSTFREKIESLSWIQMGVAVVDGDTFAELLRRPFRGRMSCDVDVYDSPRTNLHDDVHVEDSAEQRALDREVHREQSVSMIADERVPSLGD